jgi:multisubunit Na+/H+ antiporter MnhB subunit
MCEYIYIYIYISQYSWDLIIYGFILFPLVILVANLAALSSNLWPAIACFFLDVFPTYTFGKQLINFYFILFLNN